MAQIDTIASFPDFSITFTEAYVIGPQTHGIALALVNQQEELVLREDPLGDIKRNSFVTNEVFSRPY